MHFFILVLFLLSVCHCCLCELEAYDTKTNSLYAHNILYIYTVCVSIFMYT